MKGGMNRVEEAGCKCTPKTHALIVLVKKAATQYERKYGIDSSRGVWELVRLLTNF
jgi:hypothetical protein